MAPFLLLLSYIVTAALANFWEAFRDSKDVKDLLGLEDVEDFDYIDDLADMEDLEDIEDLKNIEGLKGVAAPLIIHAPSTGEGPVSIDPFFVMWSYDNEHEIESYSDKYTIVLVELDVEYDPCDDLYERYELSPIYSTDVGGADGFLDVPASEFTVFAPGETLTVDLIFYSTHDADINMCTSVRVSLFAPDPTPALASAIVTPTETIEWFPTPTTDYENKGELGAKDEDQSAGEKTGVSVAVKGICLLLVAGGIIGFLRRQSWQLRWRDLHSKWPEQLPLSVLARQDQGNFNGEGIRLG